MRRVMVNIARLALAGAGAGGCAGALGGCWYDQNSKTWKHLVIGIGIIETGSAQPPGDGPQRAAGAQHMKAAGAMIGFAPPMQGLMIGGFEHQHVYADENSNVLISAESRADGTFHAVIQPVPGDAERFGPELPAIEAVNASATASSPTPPPPTSAGAGVNQKETPR